MVNMTGRRFNDSVTVTCNDGYQYTGSTIRVCQGDGTWSGIDGICEGEIEFEMGYLSLYYIL